MVDVLTDQLKALRLKTAASELDDVLSQKKKAVSLEWLTELLQRELDARREKALKNRLRSAQFPQISTLEDFDWDFNKDIDREKVNALAELDFIKNKQIALFLGKPGTGKTHLAVAIGVRAVYQGFRVYCTSVKRLNQDIETAKMKGTLDVLFKKILSSHLWILDDWGVVGMNQDVAEEVFDLLDRRKHSTALLLTSNRDINEWPQVFPDGVLASATIDRLFDRAETVIFQGKSYRVKGKIDEPEVKNFKK